MSKSCMDLMMFSSCSHSVREADWRERKKKSSSETGREHRVINADGQRQREAMRKETPRETGGEVRNDRPPPVVKEQAWEWH